MKQMKRWMLALAMGLCTCLILSLCGFGEACEDISERVLRLHVLAASDSEEDQTLKLKVRDAIIAETDGLLDGVESTALAKKQLETVLPQIKQIAETCLRDNGCEDTVAVSLCETYFTTRQYDSVTLPAGYYDALRVVIGEGKGKNWWCVVFPPMCLSGACEDDLDTVLTKEQCDIVTQPKRFSVRFKLVEWMYDIKSWFS